MEGFDLTLLSYVANGSLFLLLPLAAVLVALLVLPSIHRIGETEVGLVSKRFSWRKLRDGNPIAFRGEAGYQAELLMPGLRFAPWLLYSVEKHPWVQIPAGQIGVVIAQIGEPLPFGAKTAVYRQKFGIFTDLEAFVAGGGQKGVQRPVLRPGTLAPVHPVAFLVITKEQVYGVPAGEEYKALRQNGVPLQPKAFGLEPEQLNVVRIQPRRTEHGQIVDVCGIVTTYEGCSLESGDIASRIGDFEDVKELKARGADASELIEALIGSKNKLHESYQDFQRFLELGGRIGLQHDPLLYGAYNLNPFLVSVELVPAMVVNQGEVAVIKAFVGLPTVDTSGQGFKFGSIVTPGHRGIWEEPLRTGKYAINPRCYQAEIVPTAIVTLNWAEEVSSAHNLDRNLSQIKAKSREGFVFDIDLQVQIHVPDTQAAPVISMVRTMDNLVNEVLQAAVGNHFRDKLQSMPAINFIESREKIQCEALMHITEKLREYNVETRGVYIQDVSFPPELVEVLTEREIANQQVQTYDMQKRAEVQRIEMEAAKGRADQQAALARAEVGVQIESSNAKARIAEAEGEATYLSETGRAKGAEIEAIGVARAKSYQLQAAALGAQATATVNVAEAVAKAGLDIVPEVYVSGGGAAEGLAAVLMKQIAGFSGFSAAEPVTAPSSPSKLSGQIAEMPRNENG